VLTYTLEHMTSNCATADIDTVYRCLGFLLGFGTLYCGLYAIYMLVPDSILAGSIYELLLGRPTAALANLVASNEQVRASGHLLASPRAELAIVRGCDGAGVAFMLVAALLALRAKPFITLAGVAAGLVLVWMANLLRLASLYFVAAYHPDWFVPLHAFVMPVALIVLIGLYFSTWVGIAMHAADKRPPRA